MNKLILKSVGGFGNQLFFLFTSISLSIDYNLELIINTKSHDNIRPGFLTYNYFQSIKLICQNSTSSITNLNLINQDGFKYKKIILNPKKNYIINKDNSGYFQSYKFFWHNIGKIKQCLNLNLNQINNFKSILTSLDSYIAIHFRLTDYEIKSDFHKVVNIDYYSNILANYNLTQYKIILFSDDLVTAKKLLSNIINPDNIIFASDYTTNDEEQLFLLACTKIRICPNSTYSLWSCYLNDIYNFNPNSIYYFPSKWFGPKGIKDYDIYDLIPKENNKYKIINV